MPHNASRPSFQDFTGWLAAKIGTRASASQRIPSHEKPGTRDPLRYQQLLGAARVARDELVRAVGAPLANVPEPSTAGRYLEVLQLLAAADKADSSRPPELTTARGFRVTLAYDEGGSQDASSICVLVRCPPELVEAVQGETAYLWNGTERFELGQFDSEGKAIGTLPAGIEISLTDFALGNVRLEEPSPPADG
jgi:hypothetical protein